MSEATYRTANPGAATAGLRASDADRERAVEQLRKHHETGHLGYAEFSSRMERAYHTTYTHELAGLIADLPGAGVGGTVAKATTSKQAKQPTGWVRILAIVGLVTAALVGLSWLTSMVTAHPILSLVGVGLVVFLVVKKPFRRRD